MKPRAYRQWIPFVLGTAAVVSLVGAQRLPASPPAVATFLLRMSHAPGRLVRMSSHVTQSGPASVGTTSIDTVLQVRTTAVLADGTAEQSATVESLNVRGRGIDPALQALLEHGVPGTALSFTQDARARVTQRSLPAQIDDDLVPVVRGILDSLDDDFCPLPEARVPMHGVWNESRTFPFETPDGMHITLTLEQTFTLHSADTNTAHIEQLATIKVPMGSSVAGLPIQADGHATGAFDIDFRAGIVSHTSVTGTLDVSFAIQTRPQHVHMTFTSTTDTSRTQGSP